VSQPFVTQEPGQAVERCPGCGVELPVHDGPVHRYMESSPACWAAYGELLAREYGDPAYMAVHRLSVDAYAVQHPGRPSPQSIRSVGVHLLALHAVLEEGSTPAEATRLMQRSLGKLRFEWLEPPADLGSVRVTDVLEAADAGAHVRTVDAWARTAWQAWSAHHPRVRSWAQQARG
jgi:hypothetical protein